MKAPDKIYIIQRPLPVKLLAPTWYRQQMNGFENYEYIRKEALLEWLDYLKGKVVGDEKRVLVLSIIDKINSL